MSAQKTNNLLLSNYNKLTDAEKKQLKNNLQDAPGLLQIVFFLDSQGKVYFKNEKILYSVYTKKELQQPLQVLENRYYKQRKKILNAIEDLKKANPTHFTDAEILLATIDRTPCNYNEWIQHQKKLDVLEIYCKENEIFELLLKSFEIRIKKNQEFKLHGNHKLIRQQRIYSALVAALQTIKEYSFEIFDVHYRYGSLASSEFLDKIKHITQKHNRYKRFNYIYNYYYLRFNSSFLKRERLKTVRFYLKKLEKRYSAHPAMPLVEYNNYYTPFIHIELLRLNANFHVIYEQHEVAEELMNKLFFLLKNNESYKTVFLQESYYHLMILVKLYNKKYSEAWAYSEEFSNWLKTNSTNKRTESGHFMKAQIILSAYPKLPVANFDYIIKSLSVWTKNRENRLEHNAYFLRLFTLAKLLFVNKNYTKALKLISNSDLKLYIQKASDYSLYHELFQMANVGKFEKAEEYKLKLLKAIYQTEVNVVRNDYEWLLKVLNTLIKV